MNKIKLIFTDPVIYLKGIKTKMVITAGIFCNGVLIKNKKFSKTITYRKPDAYDLNKAKNILQASLEQEAYIWAKKDIDNAIKNLKNRLESANSFSEKAAHIIEHDTTYIKKLMK